LAYHWLQQWHCDFVASAIGGSVSASAIVGVIVGGFLLLAASVALPSLLVL